MFVGLDYGRQEIPVSTLLRKFQQCLYSIFFAKYFRAQRTKNTKTVLHNFGKILCRTEFADDESVKKIARKTGNIKCSSANDADIR
jgi:deoxyadenosine/deoxycytidine kinase